MRRNTWTSDFGLYKNRNAENRNKTKIAAIVLAFWILIFFIFLSYITYYCLNEFNAETTSNNTLKTLEINTNIDIKNSSKVSTLNSLNDQTNVKEMIKLEKNSDEKKYSTMKKYTQNSTLNTLPTKMYTSMNGLLSNVPLEQNGSSLELNGSSLEYNGSSLEYNGSSLELNGSSLEQIGSSLEQIGSSFVQNGSSLQYKRSSLEQNKALLQQNDPTKENNSGLLLKQNGSSLYKNSSSLYKNSSSLYNKSSSLYKNSSSLNKNSSSLSKSSSLLYKNDTSSEVHGTSRLNIQTSDRNISLPKLNISSKFSTASNFISDTNVSATSEKLVFQDPDDDLLLTNTPPKPFETPIIGLPPQGFLPSPAPVTEPYYEDIHYSPKIPYENSNKYSNIHVLNQNQDVFQNVHVYENTNGINENTKNIYKVTNDLHKNTNNLHRNTNLHSNINDLHKNKIASKSENNIHQHPNNIKNTKIYHETDLVEDSHATSSKHHTLHKINTNIPNYIPRSIQDIIRHVDAKKELYSENDSFHYLEPNFEDMSDDWREDNIKVRYGETFKNDPFNSYKPRDPSDVNLMATDSLRFSPPVWSNFRNTFERPEFDAANNTKILESEPLVMTLNLFPSQTVEKGPYGPYVSNKYRITSHPIRVNGMKAKKMVIYLNLFEGSEEIPLNDIFNGDVEFDLQKRRIYQVPEMLRGNPEFMKNEGQFITSSVEKLYSASMIPNAAKISNAEKFSNAVKFTTAPKLPTSTEFPLLKMLFDSIG